MAIENVDFGVRNRPAYWGLVGPLADVLEQ